MFKAILFKEFLKIKYIYLALITLFVAFLVYLYMDIIQSFASIEPHSMLWYEAAHIGNLYYSDLHFLPSFAALVIALSQFLPEIHKKKFRIPLHLPINQNKMVLLYLSVGLLLLTLINILFLVGLYLISLSSYPYLVALSAVKTSIPWILASFIVYSGTVAIMIEPYWKRKAFLSVLFFIISGILFINMEYEAYNNVYIFLIFLVLASLFVPLLSLYRFKNGDYSLLKEKSLIPKLAFILMLILAYIGLSFWVPYYFKEFSKNNSLATYVFYSAKEQKFIYKQHFGKHNFIYGNSTDDKFTRKEYEEALPFIYWRNLDIQKKLPIVIDRISYNKSQIKKARQSFRFSHKNIPGNKKQIQLYPLFNPSSKKGVIPFPDIMFNLDKDFTIYDSEENILDKELTQKYTSILKNKDFAFPARIIAGKTTNIKPLDEGYFILDAKDSLYHLKMYDDILDIQKINYDSNIKIKYIKISESRKKEFYGILGDENDKVYIITYDNYKLIKLPLKNYNPNNMQLEIYADVLNKLIRYQDEKNVYSVAFDENFSYIADFKVGIPQVNPYFKMTFDYLFPFHIQKNPYKIYEEYSLKIGTYHAFVISFILGLLFFLLSRKEKLKSRILKSIIIVLSGIFGLIVVYFI